MPIMKLMSSDSDQEIPSGIYQQSAKMHEICPEQPMVFFLKPQLTIQKTQNNQTMGIEPLLIIGWP